MALYLAPPTDLLHVSCVEVKLVDLLVSAAAHQHVLLVVIRVEHTTVEQLAHVEGGDHLRDKEKKGFTRG